MRPHFIFSASLLIGATCAASPATIAQQTSTQETVAAELASIATPAAVDAFIAAKMAEADLVGLATPAFPTSRSRFG